MRNSKIKKEIQIYPATVFCKENGSAPYSIYEDAKKNKKIGDTTYASYGAPGYGHIIHEITRIDETGVYGFVVEDTMRTLTPEDVI